MNTRITTTAVGAAMALLLATAGVAGAYDQTVISYEPGNPLTNGCQSSKTFLPSIGR